MKRQIYLPELLNISIKNYTLYPNGLDYTFDFVKGVNLVLGGNGMGKTTFVNMIKFGIIGLYKKAMDLTRTYKERAIIKRLLYPYDYFFARKDDSVQIAGEATVTLTFRISKAIFVVTRSLDSGNLITAHVNDTTLNGICISEDRYERLNQDQKKDYLLKSYEDEIERYSNLTYDDLIFFVNEILFFGEDHKTVLWNDSFDGKLDVQNELFNKYFNEPELDQRRQDALREARYYDSLSRHKSEDMRVIKSLMEKMKPEDEDKVEAYSVPSAIDVVSLRTQLEAIKNQLASIQSHRDSLANEISLLQGEINRSSLEASKIDEEKRRLEGQMKSAIWESLHPMYDVFIKNIQLNHICPICNQEDEELVEKIERDSTSCFACGKEIRTSTNDELVKQYKEVASYHRSVYQSIANKQCKVKTIECELDRLDYEFKNIDLQRRSIQQQIRELEYQRSNVDTPDKLQTLEDEYNKLSKEKEDNQKKSLKCALIAQELTSRIEEEILNNVTKFSGLFSAYAEDFLGVKCELEYKSYDNGPKRFYPVIDGKVRRQEESLSESQRFFIDHSFRMSILTFFYQTPSFYIVETPDSSLDISYEKNAANVFARFLSNPNSVILTSNLNNSAFVSHLIKNKNIMFSLVGLPDIAKKSIIQGASEQLLSLYQNIKNEL